MRYFITFLLIFTAFASYASDSYDALRELREKIIEREMKAAENRPQKYNDQEEIELTRDDKKITVTFSRKGCMAQGNTFDECELLKKRASDYIDNYDFSKPTMPDITELKDNLFITIRIKQ